MESTGLGASGCLAQTLDDSDDQFEYHTRCEEIRSVSGRQDQGAKDSSTRSRTGIRRREGWQRPASVEPMPLLVPASVGHQSRLLAIGTLCLMHELARARATDDGHPVICSDRRFDDIVMRNKKTEANTETEGQGMTSSYGDDSDTPLPWSVTDGGIRIDGPRLAPWQRAAMRACPSSAAPAPAGIAAGIGGGMQAGACGGMAIRFVVASLRKNTTWTLTSQDECRESLSRLDWRRWRREVSLSLSLPRLLNLCLCVLWYGHTCVHYHLD